MQNFTLLRELGHARKPVLLKRGISATIEEWLLSAEYVLSGGNNDVILCERGIRTFETATRNTFDISAIPVVKKLSHLPIIADPSHGAGRRDMVAPMARAAVAAGADGLIIEVHCDPDHALSDGAQSMFPAQFDRLMAELRIIAPAIGRSICLEPVARAGGVVRQNWRSANGNMASTGIQSRLAFSRSAIVDGTTRHPTRRSGRSAQPPIFEKIGIVGLGLIGGSIALARARAVAGLARHCRRQQGRARDGDAAARDRRRRRRSDRARRGRPGRSSRRRASRTSRCSRELDDNVAAAGGRHRHRQHEARDRRGRASLPPRFTFIGGHPLGGAAQGGLEHARPDLFRGRPWLLTPTERRGAATGAREADWRSSRALGAEPRVVDVEAHDRLLAFLSHLPQLTASALMQVVGDAVGADGLALAGRGLADTTRLASSPPDIWRTSPRPTPTRSARRSTR